MSKISCQIVGHSVGTHNKKVVTAVLTFPRFLLAELNTHRVFSKNSASSRAIPFKKMVKSVRDNSFIPIAWQKEHSGMQGSEYITDENEITLNELEWLIGRDSAVKAAERLNKEGNVTKQLCNRLLEPFMWHTVIITGTEWVNFFELRCPRYEVYRHRFIDEPEVFKSRKEAIEAVPSLADFDEDDWRHHNKGQAEIHMMELAEQIYDAVRLSQPKQLTAGEWHIPFEDKCLAIFNEAYPGKTLPSQMKAGILIRLSTALCARVSYTTVGEDKDVDYNTLIKIHDKMEKSNPFHASPFEHCCVAMNDLEYYSYVQGRYPTIDDRYGIVNREHYPLLYSDQLEQNLIKGPNPHNEDIYGWCRNFRGFIQYRVKLEENNA